MSTQGPKKPLSEAQLRQQRNRNATGEYQAKRQSAAGDAAALAPGGSGGSGGEATGAERWGSVTAPGVGEVAPRQWGVVLVRREAAPGIVAIDTTHGGGLLLSPERNEAIPAPLRQADGIYHEAFEAYAVIAHHPEAFPELASGEASAEDVAEFGWAGIRNWDPDGYRAVTGRTPALGESHIHDARTWKSAHADDYVAVHATYADTPGMMRVAMRREADGHEMQVLVSEEEFEAPRAAHGSFDPPFHLKSNSIAVPSR